MGIELGAEVVVAVALAICCYTDVKDGKIRNMVTLPLIALGFLHNVMMGHPSVAIGGFVVATLIHFPLWLLTIQRGGDAKLLMGLGAMFGHYEIVETSTWLAVLYAPVGLGFLAATGKLGNIVTQIKWIAGSLMKKDVGERPPSTKLKTAPVIAAAAVLAHYTTWLDWLQ